MELDRRSFDALVSPYRPMVLTIALRILRNPDEAEDCVQEVFKSVWITYFVHARPVTSSWPALLRRIAMTTAVGLLPGRKDEPMPPDIVDERPEGDPVRVVIGRDCLRAVWPAIRRLPHNLRIAILLRVCQLSIKEIAERLRCSEAAARRRVEEARKRLRADLRKQGMESCLE